MNGAGVNDSIGGYDKQVRNEGGKEKNNSCVVSEYLILLVVLLNK
jgi:hypothetical protein